MGVFFIQKYFTQLNSIWWASAIELLWMWLFSIRPQLLSSLLQFGYVHVRCCRLKSTTFYSLRREHQLMQKHMEKFYLANISRREMVSARKPSLVQGNVLHMSVILSTAGSGGIQWGRWGCVSQNVMGQAGVVCIPACSGAGGGWCVSINAKGGSFASHWNASLFGDNFVFLLI